MRMPDGLLERGGGGGGEEAREDEATRWLKGEGERQDSEISTALLMDRKERRRARGKGWSRAGLLRSGWIHDYTHPLLTTKASTTLFCPTCYQWITVEPAVVQSPCRNTVGHHFHMSDDEDGAACCQCATTFSKPGSTASALPKATVQAFIQTRLTDPPPLRPGIKPTDLVLTALATIARILNGALAGETRGIPVNKPKGSFAEKIGWDEHTQRLFAHLGFVLEHFHPTDGLDHLKPPLGLTTGSDGKDAAEGDAVRMGLRQAALELAMIQYHLSPLKSTQESAPFLLGWDVLHLWLVGEPPTKRQTSEGWQTVQGSRSRHSSSATPTSLASAANPEQKLCDILGVDIAEPDTAVIECYRLQGADDPANARAYFDALDELASLRADYKVSTQNDFGGSALQQTVSAERYNGRWGARDLNAAFALLNTSYEQILQVDREMFHMTCASHLAETSGHASPVPFAGTLVLGGSQDKKVHEAIRVVGEMLEDSALVDLAFHRNAEMEGDWGMEDEALPTQPPPFTPSLEEAYRQLEVADTMEDDMIIAVYEIRIQDEPQTKETMTTCLRVIAEARPNSALKRFLETGQKEGEISLATNPEGPVGLQNIGNTCYLNSLLQYYFTIKPLREALLKMASAAPPINNSDGSRVVVGGRVVSEQEVERSREFVRELALLYQQLISTSAPAISPKKQLAYLALVSSKEEMDAQPLDTQPLHIVETSPSGPRNRNTSDMTRTEHVDTENAIPSPKSRVSPSKRTGPPDTAVSDEPLVDEPKDLGTGELAVSAASTAAPSQEGPKLPPRPLNPDMIFGRQNDVNECMDNVIFQIAAASQISQEFVKPEAIHQLFFGTTEQILRPHHTNERGTIGRQKTEFQHLIVDLSLAPEGDVLGIEPDFQTTLYDALDRAFSPSRVDLDGASVIKEEWIVQLPSVVQVQIQRVQFDRKKGITFKNNADLEFAETLCLDRYLQETQSETVTDEKRLETLRLREQTDAAYSTLQSLSFAEHSDTSLDAALGASADFLNTGGDDLSPELAEAISTLETEARLVSERKVQIRQAMQELRGQMERLWADQAAHEYLLHSVFMHRGSASFGHYFIYIRDFVSGNWYKYNDAQVTIVPATEVFAKVAGSNCNPYMLTYARKSDNDLIETVKRVV